MTRHRLQLLYERLLVAYGPQGWWPADDAFEVSVGAVLTQRTAWTNAAMAVQALREEDVLTPASLAGLSDGRLASLIRSSGFFRAKAATLKALSCRILDTAEGDPSLYLNRPLPELRDEVLGIRGIGPETADAILLYAGGHPSFVVDAYTRRLLERLGWLDHGASYDEIRDRFMAALPPDAGVYGEYHALIVRHAKTSCRTKPACDGCVLLDLCAEGRRLGTLGSYT